ncbi:MAG: toll/interleukin-1 receptor domain-containing protein [Anaerolineae bacterium]
MTHFFISYAKADTRSLAFALADALEAPPHTTAWVDKELRVLDASWSRQIEREIKKCDYMILLLSPDVNRPDDHVKGESYVLTEISYAKLLKRPIIPVMVQVTELPIDLVRRQYIDFTGRGDQETRWLIERICAEIGIQNPRQWREELRRAEAAEHAHIEADHLAEADAQQMHKTRPMAVLEMEDEGIQRLNPTLSVEPTLRLLQATAAQRDRPETLRLVGAIVEFALALRNEADGATILELFAQVYSIAGWSPEMVTAIATSMCVFIRRAPLDVGSQITDEILKTQGTTLTAPMLAALRARQVLGGDNFIEFAQALEITAELLIDFAAVYHESQEPPPLFKLRRNVQGAPGGMPDRARETASWRELPAFSGADHGAVHSPATA